MLYCIRNQETYAQDYQCLQRNKHHAPHGH